MIGPCMITFKNGSTPTAWTLKRGSHAAATLNAPWLNCAIAAAFLALCSIAHCQTIHLPASLEWPGVPAMPPGSTAIVRLTRISPGVALLEKVKAGPFKIPFFSFRNVNAVPDDAHRYCVDREEYRVIAAATVVYSPGSTAPYQWVQYAVDGGGAVSPAEWEGCRTGLIFRDGVYDLGRPFRVQAYASEVVTEWAGQAMRLEVAK